MHVRNLTQSLDIAYVVKDQWHLPVHKHTHFELQYIIRGSGQHIINDQPYPYQQGDLFILAPQDTHFFIFQQKSALCVIKFHETYFSQFLQDADFKKILQRLTTTNRKALPADRHRSEIIQLMQLIMDTHREAVPFQNSILRNTLVLLLTLAASGSETTGAAPNEEKIQAILQYIDRYITDKPQLSIQKIAAAFHISGTYFNEYFKRATGSPYKRYILEYALNLIAQQLIYTNKALSQLAGDFGFTDESHLSKTFKAHFGQTPSAFKKQRK